MTAAVLPWFHLACDSCELPAIDPIPSYREAKLYKDAHEWVYNGTPSFPKHTVEIREEWRTRG